MQGFPQRIIHGALAFETHQHRGKRHRQSAAGEQTLPLLVLELQAERAHLCGSGMKEGWALGDDGTQLACFWLIWNAHMNAVRAANADVSAATSRRSCSCSCLPSPSPLLMVTLSGCMCRRQQGCF